MKINKKAFFEYNLIEKYKAGIVLFGKEVKYIRHNKFNIYNSFCKIINQNIYLINFKINKLKRRNIKLLLKKKEIIKIYQKIKNTNYTIIPIKIFFSRSGFAKINIYISSKKKKNEKIKISKKKEKQINEKRLKKYYL
ncbi:MAG: SsrA-binding protein [Candidatus Shikimatogenerans bostrichidophilus]|nr:MAG: SsrA-binding protein [Candidatus Shikimatogenerans bostrichidophilus]